MTLYFHYEFLAIPSSLFTHYTMPKTVKAQLSRALTNVVQLSEQSRQVMFFLDCGALLHRVKRFKKKTYQSKANQYVSYVSTKYGHCCIVFDGHERVYQ